MRPVDTPARTRGLPVRGRQTSRAPGGTLPVAVYAVDAVSSHLMLDGSGGQRAGLKDSSSQVAGRRTSRWQRLGRVAGVGACPWKLGYVDGRGIEPDRGWQEAATDRKSTRLNSSHRCI